MRYRKLTVTGDFQFGHGAADFWKDQPEAVGQAIKTRLLLFSGEWFLDTIAGTPWGGFPLNDLVVRQGRILAEHTHLSRDAAIRERIITTDGVRTINNYGSSFNANTRAFSVNATVDTVYGRQISLVINAEPQNATVVRVAVVQPPPTRPAPPLLTRRQLRLSTG